MTEEKSQFNIEIPNFLYPNTKSKLLSSNFRWISQVDQSMIFFLLNNTSSLLYASDKH